jgi:hypothetical protein
MSLVTYEIIEHDGGWAYRFAGTYSETFPSHDAALKAARRAAAEQRRPGDTTGIQYEDERGQWRQEVSSGEDRPDTEVEG